MLAYPGSDYPVANPDSNKVNADYKLIRWPEVNKAYLTKEHPKYSPQKILFEILKWCIVYVYIYLSYIYLILNIVLKNSKSQHKFIN